MSESTANSWVGTTNGRPTIGAESTRSKSITAADVERFAAITGDRNPLHFDEEFAGNSVFGQLIVPGGLTSGILNAIVAQDLPGPGTVFLSVEWRFVKAVQIGETIVGSVRVTSVRDDKPICLIETLVRNEVGEDCLTGTAATYTASPQR